MKKTFPVSSFVCMFAGCAADQFIKLLSAPLSGTAPVTLIPGIVELTYIRNTGVSFGMLGDTGMLPVILSALLIVAVLLFLFLRPVPRASRILLGLILAGALGNLIDRLFRGFVVDMFHFTFFSFPVFNFADILITLSCFTLMLTILFRKEPDQSAPAGEV